MYLGAFLILNFLFHSIQATIAMINITRKLPKPIMTYKTTLPFVDYEFFISHLSSFKK